ncbi:MAG: fatty acid desaturase [Gemmataceae bacterium]|nr:fatty acid desaturase [Gemmata sp.]MDW8197932.1 fatty acid desaturase [Gemmataceae bacterium]
MPASTVAKLPPAPPRYSFPRRFFAWWGTFLGVTLPLAGLVMGVVLSVLWGFSWVHVGLCLGMYLLTMTGITVGFHRLFTHRSFQTSRPVEFLLGVLGSMTFQGPLLDWVGRHRLHHRHSDAVGDPHSPHPHEAGIRGLLRGFWRAHIGWAFAPMPDDLDRYAGDLRRRPMLRLVNDLFPLWAVLGLVIPAGLGWAFLGWQGAITGFIWGGLVRILLGHHVTWCVNSVCHLWGRKPYASGDESRNNAVIGVLALGEGWHNNHHAFPSSARHGLRWWQLDFSYGVIRLMQWCGLAWRVRLPTPQELQRRGEAPPSPPQPNVAARECDR